VIDSDFILEVFEEVMPMATISDLPLVRYVDNAKKNPFIELQVRMGIYNDENIYEDFLSPAVAHAGENRVIYSSELMQNLMYGVPDRLASIWVLSVASHEASHLTQGHVSTTWEESLAIESQMHDHDGIDKAIAVLAALAETESAVFQRVYARIESLSRELESQWTLTT
jgi:hypothetical protein